MDMHCSRSWLESRSAATIGLEGADTQARVGEMQRRPGLSTQGAHKVVSMTPISSQPGTRLPSGSRRLIKLARYVPVLPACYLVWHFFRETTWAMRSRLWG